MRKRLHPDMLHTTVWILYVGLIVISVIIGVAAYIFPHTESGFNDGPYITLGDGFAFTLQNGTAEKAYFPAYFGKTEGSMMTIEGRLPEKINEDTTLFIFSYDQDLVIYIDGKRAGTYMGASSYAGGGGIPDVWYTVPVHSDSGGKLLKISVSVHSGKAIGYIYPIYFGDRTAVIYRLISDGMLPVLNGILMTLIGFLITAYATFKMKKGGMEYVYMGTFMFFSGLWFFFSSDIRQIYLPNADYAENMAAVALVMLHFPLIMLTAERIRRQDTYYPDEVVAYVALLGGSAYSIAYREIMHRIDWKSSLTWAFFIFGICGIIDFRRWLYEENSKERRALVRSEEKTAFLSDMSHAIRTPANTVLGMDTMILRKSTDSSVQEYAKGIAGACQSLLSIIDDILDFSKIGNGEIKIQPVRYSLKTLIADCYNMIVIRANEKGLEFHVSNDPMIPDSLFGDELRVRQIVVNLLTNAVKYTNAGSIELDVDFEQIDESSIRLYISVRDTGVGIREEDMSELFESYRRLDESRNSHIEGTGLGLSITKHLAELMGGDISVESTYGKGSVFHVSLPQKTMGKNVAGDVGQYLAGGSGREIQHVSWFRAPDAKVLIVDDVEMNLKVMAELLEVTGIQTDLVMSGEECLKKIVSKRYDLIFLDHMMPEMDGEETFRRMNVMSGNLNAQTHVIMLTANAIKGAKEAYLKEGFSGYLAKPVKEEELKNICLAYLPKSLIQKKEISTEAAAAAAVAEVKPDRRLQELEKVINTSEGLSNSMNDTEFYFEILQDYIEKNRLQKLNETFEASDWEAYRINVHSLKSTSRTIGAAELGDEAYALEMAAGDKDEVFIREHHANMMEHYNELLKKLEETVKA